MHAMSLFLFDYICGVYMKWLKEKSIYWKNVLVKRTNSISFVLVHFSFFLGWRTWMFVAMFQATKTAGTPPKFLISNNIILPKFTRFWLVKLHMHAGVQLIFNRTKRPRRRLGRANGKIKALGRAKGERNFKKSIANSRCFKRQFLVYSFELLCLRSIFWAVLG